MAAALTLPRVVTEAARRFGGRTAIAWADGWALSYADLDRLSDEAAAGLARRGVSHGSVVALALPSSPDYVVAYLACAKLGAVTAGVNPRSTAAERTKVLDALGPDVVLADAGAPMDGAVIVERSTSPDDVLADVRVTGVSPRALDDDPGRVVCVVFTSGTTGVPKGAAFSNRRLAAISEMDAGTGWGGGGPMLSSTELCHVGFMTKLPWYLRLGMTVHLLRRWRAADAMDVIERERIASIGGIPSQVALMLRDASFDARNFSAVETIVTGGGPASPALIAEACERFGSAYSVRYSSTESGGLGTLTAFDAPDEERLFTVGRPRAGISLEIRSPEGRVLGRDDVGEVWLRSPAQMDGYWRNAHETARTVVDGWLRTGDLGYVDGAGCLRLVGRGKEMYVRGGYNVYPMEVEQVLSSHPAVADVCVVPRSDDVMGSIGVAVVVPVGEPPSLEDLREHAGRHLARYKLPEAVRIVDALPVTSMHKVDRRRLIAEESDR